MGTAAVTSCLFSFFFGVSLSFEKEVGLVRTGGRFSLGEGDGFTAAGRGADPNVVSSWR